MPREVDWWTVDQNPANGPWEIDVTVQADEVYRFVGAFLPHEPAVRRWLRSRRTVKWDEDDIIQESYARIARAAIQMEIIHRPRAYFLRVARNIMLDKLRRDKIVPIDSMLSAELVKIPDNGTLQDDQFIAAQEAAFLKHLIAGLPERCQRIFFLRKLDGLSQRETAERLGLTENVVEKDVAKALRLLSHGIRESDGSVASDRPSKVNERADAKRG